MKFSGRIRRKLFSEICKYAKHEKTKSDFFRNHLVRNHSPGILEQLHQKLELRKASGLDSWKDVPTPTFQLDLGPCHFTNGYGLKGDLCMCMFLIEWSSI